VKKIHEYHIVIVGKESNEEILTDEVLRSAHRLLAIGIFCVFKNQVHIPTSQAMGIPIFTAPYQHQHSVAELIISYIVLLSRQIGDRSKEIHSKNWNKTSNDCHEVRGKTLGIVGYGHVGSQLGIMAEALSLRVIYYDSVALMPIGRASPCASLADLLSTSDFVSINVSNIPENKRMIGQKELALMKPKSYLINTSFGDAVDQDALADAIKSGHLAGAAVDSFPTQTELEAFSSSKFNSPLQNLPNVILTPHYGIHKVNVARFTTESAQRAGTEITLSISRYINDGTTSGAVNFPSLAAWPLKPGCCRILSMHRNVRGVLREIDHILSAYNVGKQVLDTKEGVGYLIADVFTESVSKEIVSQMAMLANTIRTRII
jgi:D-3-phosphoglycerate dehydrogenase / 2-oxoglutarate reductase